jgi:ATP-dependent protease HslVU (ClpYQ) peptidase subunit
MTTICSVRYNNQTAIAGDGQVTLGEKYISKKSAKILRRIYNKQVVIGFAGGVADAVSLEEMLEDKYKNMGFWLNMIEGQKVKTVRTEEAMFICLGQLNTLIRQACTS